MVTLDRRGDGILVTMVTCTLVKIGGRGDKVQKKLVDKRRHQELELEL